MMHGINNLRARVWLKTENYRQTQTNLCPKNITEQYNYAVGNGFKTLELRYRDPDNLWAGIGKIMKEAVMKNRPIPAKGARKIPSG